jgi:hypothetical protein
LISGSSVVGVAWAGKLAASGLGDGQSTTISDSVDSSLNQSESTDSVLGREDW